MSSQASEPSEATAAADLPGPDRLADPTDVLTPEAESGAGCGSGRSAPTTVPSDQPHPVHQTDLAIDPERGSGSDTGGGTGRTVQASTPADEPDGGSTAATPTAYDRYMRRAEPVMLVLALASVPLFLLEEFFLVQQHTLPYLAGWAIVAVFAVDLAVRLWLNQGSSRAYLQLHWFDAAIVVLSILPFLRPLRALRALRALRGVRGLIAAHKAAVMLERNVRSLRGKGLILSCMVLSVAAVFLVYLTEREAGGDIDSVQDALWWAAATVTTGEGGDLSPDTDTARAAAVVVMVCGVSLFGLITANVSARFLKDDAINEAPLTYDQMVELISGLECPNCGYTRASHPTAAGEEQSSAQPSPEDDQGEQADASTHGALTATSSSS